MRSTATQYVGIDVHQATLVCHVKDENGRTSIESKVTTRAEAITNFIRGLGGQVEVAFEEGSQAQWLYELLEPVAKRVIVCDPRKIGGKGNKNDRLQRTSSLRVRSVRVWKTGCSASPVARLRRRASHLSLSKRHRSTRRHVHMTVRPAAIMLL